MLSDLFTNSERNKIKINITLCDNFLRQLLLTTVKMSFNGLVFFRGNKTALQKEVQSSDVCKWK